MAVRTPLKLDGSNNLIEMDATDIANIKAQCRYLYGLLPSADLTQVASAGTLGTLNDTRQQAGASSSSVSAFPLETVTAEPTNVTVAYARISQVNESTTQPADTSNLAFPVYQSSGNIYAMTATDMYDTFINDAIATLADGTDRPGTYRIHTATSLAGHTLVSATPVFVDTRPDTSLYTAAGIPEVLDQPTTINNFYLMVTDAGSSTAYSNPVFIRAADNHLQQYTTAAFNTLLQDFMRHAATSVVGRRLTYNINGSGNNKGSAMTDTNLQLTGVTTTDGNYQTLFVGVDDYRAQEFPSGSVVTTSTYNLRLALT
jgi:hypothetical protein